MLCRSSGKNYSLARIFRLTVETHITHYSYVLINGFLKKVLTVREATVGVAQAVAQRAQHVTLFASQWGAK